MLKNKRMTIKGAAYSVMAVVICGPSLVHASGYHFGTQSVSAQSTANASAAEAADASTIYYNPAGISKLEGTNFSLNANLVAPSVKYSNAKASYPGFPQKQDPVVGSTSGKITDDIIAVPHMYATHQLSDQWTLGLGVYVPFASGTEYDEDSVLRYNVNKTEVSAIDINPTIAFKINDQHSISVGLIGQYLSAELRQFANWGKFINQEKGNGLADGYSAVEGDDWGFGYNFGYLWDVNDNTRLGVSYRSKVDHELRGSAEWKTEHPLYSTPAGAAALPMIQGSIATGGLGYAKHENARVKIVTPESLSLHGMVELDDKWTAFGDVTWTRHSRFNKINIEFEQPKIVANAVKGGKDKSNITTLQPNWKDTFKVGLGAAYQYDDQLQLRFGVAFDESPVKSADYRLSTMPDNDRIWLSLGAKYDFNENSSLNIGYSYIHIKDGSANVNGWCGSRTPLGPGASNCVSSRTNGSADYDSHAHILGIQYNYRF